MRNRGSYHQAITMLMQPHARLVLSYTLSSTFGRAYHLEPGGRISEETAQAILRRSDIRPLDTGLFPGRPQSWTLVRQR